MFSRRNHSVIDLRVPTAREARAGAVLLIAHGPRAAREGVQDAVVKKHIAIGRDYARVSAGIWEGRRGVLVRVHGRQLTVTACW